MYTLYNIYCIWGVVLRWLWWFLRWFLWCLWWFLRWILRWLWWFLKWFLRWFDGHIDVLFQYCLSSWKIWSVVDIYSIFICSFNREPSVSILSNLIRTEKTILNPVKSNQIWIVITLFRLIWNRTDFCLVLNHSEKCNYISNLFWLRIHRNFFGTIKMFSR